MKGLKKTLGFWDVLAVAVGAMISSGLFVLPGLAYAQTGPSVILSYLLAGFACIPTLFSMAELATAMPKAGGDYFYIMRGFGPLLGTLSGFSSWFSLSLKSAFALVGMAAYIARIVPLDLNLIAICLCLFFVILNLLGVKEATKLQLFLVLGLAGILLLYFSFGIGSINLSFFYPFLSNGAIGIFKTTAFVFISYAGLTHMVSLSEEVRDPGKNIPRALFMSLVIVIILYSMVIITTVGILPGSILENSLTPVSDTARIIGGRVMEALVTTAAFLAFISTANAGIMAASRYPLGMSRDGILPEFLAKINRFKVPYMSVLTTGMFIAFSLFFLPLQLLIKVASCMLIVLYIFANLGVVFFRESRIKSYKPRFYSPFYPYMQVIGVLIGIFLLIEMGSLIVFLTLSFMSFSWLWYKLFSRRRGVGNTALLYMLERIISRDKELASEKLHEELAHIVIEREGLIDTTTLEIIKQADVLDIKDAITIDDLFDRVAISLSETLKLKAEVFLKEFKKRRDVLLDIVERGVAIPHIFLTEIERTHMVLVRAKNGIVYPDGKKAWVAFVLVGPAGERQRHLKILAVIADIVQDCDFVKKCLIAEDEEELIFNVLLAQKYSGRSCQY